MNIHFISIGGSVMHQLAISLQKKGYFITGSDDEIFEPSKTNLANYGLLPNVLGWNEANIHAGLDAVILGMHARADNPEIIQAKKLNLPIYSFPEYIFKESQHKKRVVIGGSHGKTTTTSMIMHVLRSGGRDFDFLVGAKLPGFEQSVDITDAPVIICEGDEYPASAIERRPKFHFLFPHIAVLTGIAWDHINIFPTFNNYLDQFNIFLDKLEQGGTLIYNSEDPVLKELVEKHTRKDLVRIGYGLPSFKQCGNTTSLTIEEHEVSLQVFGNHNLLNIQAAWLVCKELGIDANVFANAISTFTGASKRLEVMAESSDRIVFRDFAHAPSKVKATMEAVKQQYPGKKVAAILELHTYSSLSEAFMPHYAGALDAADSACVFYSPHALEIKRMPPLAVETIKAGFAKPGLTVLTQRKELEKWIELKQKLCDNLLLMSSGNYDGMDITAVANDWVYVTH
jgi:UDP-N-acetylmuramate: L-alanyl-gamma-D-glutamyl-meso-diaminopimelate ligase